MFCYHVLYYLAKVYAIILPYLGVLVHPIMHQYCLYQLFLPVIHRLLYRILASKVLRIILVMYRPPVLNLFERFQLPRYHNLAFPCLISVHHQLLFEELQALLQILRVLVILYMQLVKFFLKYIDLLRLSASYAFIYQSF